MDPDDVPTLRGQAAVLAYCHDIGAVGITAWRVRTAVESNPRELVPHVLGRQLWFSRNVVHRWLDSMMAPEPCVFMGVHAGRAPSTVPQ